MIDKNKKHQLTIIFALSLTLIFVLAACGGQSGNTATGNTANQPNTENEMAENTSADNTASEDSTANTAGEEEMTEANDTSTESSASSDASATYSFAADVKPIFDSRCMNCHGGERTENDFVVLSYDELMAGGEHGTVIVPGDAASSKLVQLIESGKMPKRGPKVTPVELEIISTWINEGAPNN